MKKHSLMKYFTIYSLIAFSLTGAVLAFIISNHIKNDKIEDAQNMALLTLDAIVKPALDETDFEVGLSYDKNNQLDKIITNVIANTNITSVSILNRQGQIIYSSDSQLIGTYFSHNDDLIKVLSNKLDFNISMPHKDINSSSIDLEYLRILAPIAINNAVIGVYEVFVPYNEIKVHIMSLNKLIIFIVFAGLLVLYLLLLKIIHNASSTLISQNQALLHKAEELQESYGRLNFAYRNTIAALSNAVDARDKYTAGHSDRVARIALLIGKELGLKSEQLQILEMAALFHDIGKVGIRDEVLLKAGKLSDEEFEVIKLHPQIGVNILKSIDFLQEALPIILHHHEKYAGGGYPSKLLCEQIPLESRIIAIADTYDAMTSDRPYRKGMTHEMAAAEILKYKGIQFDDKLVDIFFSIEDKIKADASGI